MRVTDNGSFFGVSVSAAEVETFNRRWPCSRLRGAYWFEFDKRNGDLVDGRGHGDGEEHLALSHDAQRFGERELLLGEWAQLPAATGITLTIENPNSSGQGFCEQCKFNPHHALLVARGWKYSHSTPIGRPDGTRYIHHTYKMPRTDWSIGVDHVEGFKVSFSRAGSGRRTVIPAARLPQFLKRKLAESAICY